jgi:hypothetical protein
LQDFNRQIDPQNRNPRQDFSRPLGGISEITETATRGAQMSAPEKNDFYRQIDPGNRNPWQDFSRPP